MARISTRVKSLPVGKNKLTVKQNHHVRIKDRFKKALIISIIVNISLIGYILTTIL